jgi:argininosuccinate lyase
MQDIVMVQKALITHARKYRHAVVPGYTHMQRAQPVTWAYNLLGWFYKLQRDSDRLQDAWKRVNVSPLGACALAGTVHNIDPECTAALLGFERFVDNCMDGVSDRDFLFEITCVCAHISVHLTSFAEECILYSTEEFAHIQLDDSIATGSSIMPHKKNADVFEILRARSGTVIGNVVALFSIGKGLPGVYNRDLQETKRIFFSCIQLLHACLNIIAHVLPKLYLTKNDWAKKPAMCCAINLVDHVISAKRRFRKAYHAVSACVRLAQGDINAFIRLCAKRFNMEEADVATLLTPKCAVEVKSSKNSTGSKQVKRALLRASRQVKRNDQKIKILKTVCRKKI